MTCRFEVEDLARVTRETPLPAAGPMRYAQISGQMDGAPRSRLPTLTRLTTPTTALWNSVGIR
jgi:hypothetical protein